MQTLIITIFIIIFIMYFYFTKEGFKSNDSNEILLKNYLLNTNNLYGKNRPNIWIHSIYEINSRNWTTFQDRNSYNFNQPYIDLSIQTIIEHCSNNFNIFLINDDSFSKLIPNWKWPNMSIISEPKKKNIRNYGLLLLIYFYGGIIVPNSFICFRNLESLFKPIPFVIETINHTLFDFNKTFSPSVDFIGIRNKNNPIIKKYIQDFYPNDFTDNILIKNNKKIHKTFKNDKEDWNFVGIENDINGKSRNIIQEYVKENNLFMWSGNLFGIKDNNGNPILIENLMEDNYLDIPNNIYGILIDSQEILRRTKYNWLLYIKPDDNNLLNLNNILSKYLNKALIDGKIINK